MMHLRSLFYLLAISALSFVTPGCDSASSDDREPALYGHIVDEKGESLSDVAVHFRLHFEPPQVIPVGERWTRTIEVIIPQTVHVKLEVLRFGTREPVHTLIDQLLQAGEHRITLEPFILTTGLYLVRLEAGDDPARESSLLVHADNDYLSQTEPVVRSDNRGEFVFDYTIIGIGETIEVINEQDLPVEAVVLPNITIVLFKEGFSTLEVNVGIDQDRVIDQEFQMERLSGGT